MRFHNTSRPLGRQSAIAGFGISCHGQALALLVLLAILAGCAGPVPSVPTPISEERGELVVAMVGFRSDRGEAIVSVFRGEKGFPDDMERAIANLTVPVVGGTALAQFRNLPYGWYAVAVLHDENGDGRMDSGWLGTPQEGFGFSGAGQGHFGPPPFDEARIGFFQERRTVAVTVGYFQGFGRGRPQ